MYDDASEFRSYLEAISKIFTVFGKIDVEARGSEAYIYVRAEQWCGTDNGEMTMMSRERFFEAIWITAIVSIWLQVVLAIIAHDVELFRYAVRTVFEQLTGS